MLKVELLENKQSALILTNYFGRVYRILKKFLEEKEIKVYTGRARKEELGKFDYVFFIDPPFSVVKELYPFLKQALIIFTHKTKEEEKIVGFLKKGKGRKVKAAGVSSLNAKEHLERALWFFFSDSEEVYLPLALQQKKKSPRFSFPFSFEFRWSLKKVLIFLIVIFLIYNLFFWSLLGASFVAGYYELSGEKKFPFSASSLYNLSSLFYKKVRPVYHFFFLGSGSDKAFKTGESLLKISKATERLKKDLPQFVELALKPAVSFQELELQKSLLEKVKKEVRGLIEEVAFLERLWPDNYFKKERKRIVKIKEFLSLAKDFFEVYEDLFPKNESRKYLIVFANNMELRPGGGFIGSFGILKTRPLGVESIKLYDVYDADGQLKVHFDPPEAIRKYLNQPHWFLRDSNFSPDLSENYKIAKKILSYELPKEEISGMVVITTTAVQEVLRAYGSVYLPDYKEVVTADNFYLKAQNYAQDEFFPGSLNKKSFLFSLFNQLLVEAERVDPVELLSTFKRMLDQKQIAFYFENKKLQEFFDRNSWSGRMIQPKCLVRRVESCLLDYIFPVEANLGVNKANFYVKNRLDLIVEIKDNGEISSQLTYILRNDSPSRVFPGGDYKNYFRLFLLKDIIPDGFNLLFYKENIAFTDKFIIVPAGEEKILRFSWKNSKHLKKGTNIYQLIVQKQLGGGNFDFSLKIVLPANVYLVNQNFSPLVKEGVVLYNTYLSSDKIFLLELVKE